MESTTKHISAEDLRELFERTGLSFSQFARLFGGSERSLHLALGTAGIQSPRGIAQYERVSELVAELELRAIGELTPLVAFNSHRLPEAVLRSLLSSSSGPSAFSRLLSAWGSDQVLQSSDLSVRDRLGVS
jgi:hypothetical protein